ncbi:adenylyl-sulfate kinase [Oleidesulfovibrio sp.]|uniref:adenylyl-sulfate kinase n=1 Tax=Oleidesulfovibrio sp. TaxID=2909707 RepID=UPI003A8B693C
MANSGSVVWITGLSGAGKTTIARALVARMPGAILLDGDELRAVLGAASSSFEYEKRKELAFTYARLCKLLAEQGLTVIIATISLFHDVHAWNRAHLPSYLEVFLDISEEIRQARDPKGLYAAAQQGHIRHMAGMETPVETPLAPDLVITASSHDTLEANVQCLLDRIQAASSATGCSPCKLVADS